MEMYVLQVKSGCEYSVTEKLKGLGFSALCPTWENHIRQGGQWKLQEKLIFTQYVFIECELDDDVYYKIKSADGVVRFLGFGRPQPLSADEQAYIEILGNNGEPIKASKVYTTISGDKMIMSGILRKYADKITFLDARQRKAKVELTLHGKKHTITLPIVGI